jgi:hypothetical protein
MTSETNDSWQQKDVIADYANELQQIEMEGYERVVRKARNTVFRAGGLIFPGEMISMFAAGTGFNLIIALSGAGIFIAFAFWTKKKTYTAVISGLLAFTCIIILGAVANSVSDGAPGVLKALFSGILVKVIILINLIIPIKDAKTLQEAEPKPLWKILPK